MKFNMKPIIIFSLFLLSMGVSAQQEKGDFQIQAQMNFTSVSTSGTATSLGMIMFNVSRFFTKNIEAGISPQIMIIKNAGSTRLALFSNYSFLTKDAKLVPYAGAQILISAQKQPEVGANAQITYANKTTVGFGLRGGARYFVTERINIDAGPNLSFSNKTTTFVFNIGVGVILGKR